MWRRTDSAERRETSCSGETPPNSTQTLNFFKIESSFPYVMAVPAFLQGRTGTRMNQMALYIIFQTDAIDKCIFHK